MFFGRLLLASSACLFLTNCSLINTAIRLAPYLLLFADENGQPKQGVDGTSQGAQQRGLEIQQRGRFAPQLAKWVPPAQGESQMAAVAPKAR